MQARSFVSWSVQVLIAVLVMANSTWAQFTGNIQGTVTDPSGAAVAQAKVSLINVVTKVSATTTTDASGDYRFLSLAPGSYKIGRHGDRSSNRHRRSSAREHRGDTESIDARNPGAVDLAATRPEHDLARNTGTRCDREGSYGWRSGIGPGQLLHGNDGRSQR